MSTSSTTQSSDNDNVSENTGTVQCNKEIQASTATIPTPSSATPCLLLDKLSPELRNTIYDLSFTTDADSQAEINLFRAVGPSKSLILTCRQVHNEAAGLHKLAYRRYWTTGKFTANLTLDNTLHVPDGVAKLRNALAAVREVDLLRVRSLFNRRGCVK